MNLSNNKKKYVQEKLMYFGLSKWLYVLIKSMRVKYFRKISQLS